MGIACSDGAAQERLRASALAAPTLGAAAPPAATRAIACGGAEMARGAAGRVVDGRTFLLADGRAVHLAGIEVPLLPLPQQSALPSGGVAARDALAALLDGAQVVLRRAESSPDRYGRIVAYVDALHGNSDRSIQAELVSMGFARVGANIGGRDCAAELLRRESIARAARRGLWADPTYRPLPAGDPARILAWRGRFAVVDGKVLSVHESGAIVYVNFGWRWSTEFSAVVRRRNAPAFAAAGLNLKALAGRRVEVRGFVEAHGGLAGIPWHAPWIEVTHPEQIEPAGSD